MKKNIKLISVTAAALLAVAPVVATTSTANAAVRVNGSLMTFTYSGKNMMNMNVAINALPEKTTVKDIIKSIKLSLSVDGKGEVPAEITYKDAYITNGDDEKLSDNDTLDDLVTGNYAVVLEGLQIKGLPAGENYKIGGGLFGKDEYNVREKTFTAEELAKPHTFTTETFGINDPSLKETGYFTQNGKKLPNAPYEQGILTKVTLSLPTSSNTMNIKKIADAIYKQKYEFVSDGDVGPTGEEFPYANADLDDWNQIYTQVAATLEYSDIPYTSDGQFTIPTSRKLSNIKFINITNNGAHNTLAVTADFAEKSSSSSSDSSTTAPSTNVNTDNSSTTTSSSNNDSSSTSSSSATTSSSSSSTTSSTNTEEKLGKKHSMTVMYNAYVYNKDHERVGTKTIKAFSKINVYGKKTTLNDGEPAYQIGKGEYIVANNVTGVKRTLKHNAFIYSTSKKRANRKVLKKGAKITTYGGKVTFKNGKQYYRIEGATKHNKMYVKVANFK